MSAALAERGFSYASDELDAMVEAVNYYRWITARFRPYLGARILEVGAGIGTYSAFLRAAAPDAHLRLVEPAANLVPRLRERFAGDPRVAVTHGVLGAGIVDASVDSVVAVNVLEHVADDGAFAAHAARVLAPGGHLLLFVPAGPALFGTLDEAFEHHRRYTRGGLRALLTGAGLQVKDLRYSNLPGVAAWWLSGRVLRRRTITPRAVRAYDRWAIPWIRRMERFWSPPLGQSLIAVAMRPGG